jgi:hypothetical protein
MDVRKLCMQKSAKSFERNPRKYKSAMLLTRGRGWTLYFLIYFGYTVIGWARFYKLQALLMIAYYKEIQSKLSTVLASPTRL